MEKLPYDPLKDLQPVTVTLKTNNLFVVPASSPAKTLKEFIDLARSQTAQGSYGSYGIGSAAHLNGELFKQQTGTVTTHVPYNQFGLAIGDLIADRTNFMFLTASAAIPQIQGGKLKAMAVTGAKRLPALKEVPTMAEAGIKDMVVTAWFGFVAPAGTPPDIINKLHQATKKVLIFHI